MKQIEIKNKDHSVQSFQNIVKMVRYYDNHNFWEK